MRVRRGAWSKRQAGLRTRTGRRQQANARSPVHLLLSRYDEVLLIPQAYLTGYL